MTRLNWRLAYLAIGMLGALVGVPSSTAAPVARAPATRPAKPGQPAPVPRAVMMSRPSPEEVASLNAALKRFVDAGTSPDAALLRTYEGFIRVPNPRPNAAIRPVQTNPRTDRLHNAFVKTANTGDFDILFDGDSITDWWQQPAPNGGAAMLKKHFGDAKVANFAVAGDSTQGVLWGLQNGEGQGHRPKAVMLMIGTNNTRWGGDTAPEIAEGIGAVVLELRKDFPDAKILLLAIFPRGSGPNDPLRATNDDVNQVIARLDDHEHVFFRNINDRFLAADGSLIGFRPDYVHPTEQGYDAWGAAVAETLKGWVR